MCIAHVKTDTNFVRIISSSIPYYVFQKCGIFYLIHQSIYPIHLSNLIHLLCASVSSILSYTSLLRYIHSIHPRIRPSIHSSYSSHPSIPSSHSLIHPFLFLSIPSIHSISIPSFHSSRHPSLFQSISSLLSSHPPIHPLIYLSIPFSNLSDPFIYPLSILHNTCNSYPTDSSNKWLIYCRTNVK